MTHLALNLFPQKEIDIAFLSARGRAIQSYATVEQSLVTLFAHLIGISQGFAGIPFFRINNARSRNAILERLLKKRYKSTYNIFWNSLEKQLNVLDGERNNIVHWLQITQVIDNGIQAEMRVSLKLIPPNYWDHDENTPEIRIDDLYDFIVKCDFFARLTEIFQRLLENPQELEQPLRDIYLQPVSYPPLEAHPLRRKPKTPVSPPESSSL